MESTREKRVCVRERWEQRRTVQAAKRIPRAGEEGATTTTNNNNKQRLLLQLTMPISVVQTGV